MPERLPQACSCEVDKLYRSLYGGPRVTTTQLYGGTTPDREARARSTATEPAAIVPTGPPRGGGPAAARVGPLGRLGRYTATHFRTVLVAWLVIAVVLGFFAVRVE